MATQIVANKAFRSVEDQLCIEKVNKFKKKNKKIWLTDEDGGMRAKQVRVPYAWCLENKDAFGLKMTEEAINNTLLTEKFNRLFPPLSDDKHSIRPKEYQVEAHAQMLGILRKEKTLFMNVRCGWGKTKIGLLLSLQIGGRILILEETALIGTGWYNTIRQDCGNYPKPVFLKKGVDYSRDMHNRFFIAPVETLVNIKNEHLPKGINVVVVDEARCFLTSRRIGQLIRLDCNYLIGASADIDRVDGMHKAIPLFFGDKDRCMVTRIWTEPFDYIRIYTDIKPDVVFEKSGWGSDAHMSLNWGKVIGSIAENKGFNSTIVSLAKLLRRKKVLILGRFVEQLLEIYTELYNSGEDVNILYKTAKKHVDANIIIATVGKAYKGYDIRSVAEAWDGRDIEIVINITDTLEPEQRFGRGFRVKRPMIINFVHSLPKLHEHDKVVTKWCTDRNAEITDIYISILAMFGDQLTASTKGDTPA